MVPGEFGRGIRFEDSQHDLVPRRLPRDQRPVGPLRLAGNEEQETSLPKSTVRNFADQFTDEQSAQPKQSNKHAKPRRERDWPEKQPTRIEVKKAQNPPN